MTKKEQIIKLLEKYGNETDLFKALIIKDEFSDLVDDLVKLCAIPDVVGRSEQLICPCCGSDKTYKTDAIHCNRCAVTTEI